MKSNGKCEGSEHVNVFLDGRQLEYCIEADEEAGVAWILFQDADGDFIHEKLAPPRCYVSEGAMVLKLEGRVEIKIEPPEGMTEAEVRAALESTYKPEEIKIKGE